MRIRSLKPEFWTHPVMAKLDDYTKLLAIGLLNYADDEGYFYADPVLVRNALTPFTEDSRKTHGALRELSQHGYVRLCEHPQHGMIGQVVNFTKHQYIQRPSRSKIACYFVSEDSRNCIGGVSEVYQPDQGSGIRDQGTYTGGSPDGSPVVVSRFTPPTIEEVRLLVAKMGMPESKADEFVSFYESKGWMVGKNKMRKWQQALVTWKVRWEQERKPQQQVMKNCI